MNMAGLSCESAHTEFLYYYDKLACETGEPRMEALLVGLGNDLDRFSEAIVLILERLAKTAESQNLRDHALDLLLYSTAAGTIPGCKPAE